jgi:uncharacterized coiled-coil DUF342 family protein
MATTDQLQSLKTRVKSLAANRDKLIRDAGAKESQLEQAYDKLRELGVQTPELLSTPDLQALAEKYEVELGEKVEQITVKVTEGEKLLADYNGT